MEDARLYAKDGGEFFTELPFFYDGIPVDEFDREERYFAEHWEDYKHGKYQSLRQQGYFKNSAKA